MNKSNSRLNWAARQSPTDLDDQPQVEPVIEFDLTRPWPKVYFGQTFGPALINRARNKGFFVLAELTMPPGAPTVWAVSKAQWNGESFEVLTLQGWKIPERVWTSRDLKGVKF